MRKIAIPILLAITAWVVALPALAAPPAVPAAPDWQPISVAIECQSWGRTDVCNTLLLALIDDEPLLAHGRFDNADVVLHVNVTEAGRDDLIDLRFTSGMPGVDASTELVVGVPAFGTFDEQLAPLRYALRRGVIPFVAARYPDAVRVELVAPQGARAAGGSPWDLLLSAHGSHSGQRSSGSSFTTAHLNASVRRTTRQGVGALWLDLGYARWKPGDMSTGSDEVVESVVGQGAVRLERHAIGSLWIGAALQARTERSEHSASDSARAHALAILRFFPVDDRRGNVFDIVYGIGGESTHAELDGEVMDDEQAPTHSLGAQAAVRFDRVTLSGQLAGFSRLDGDVSSRWFRAHQSITWRATRNLDLAFALSQEKGALGSSTEDWGYAAGLSVELHWDRSNGARRVFFAPLP